MVDDLNSGGLLVAVGDIFTQKYPLNGNGCILNRLSPHDALKHHLTSLKTHLIFLQPRVFE